ncbi:Gamma-tubulin complex component 3 [Quaeritorhiza haematococci]|nr:Gamma-tubulin complex component 3 [Quaeritorhiza haematococci]
MDANAPHEYLRLAQRTLPEPILLRDILYVFQGIDGKYVRYDTSVDAFVVDPEANILRPTRELLHRLSELGWLYRKVHTYIEANKENPAVGVVGQSLCAAMQQELGDYFRLLAILEKHVAAMIASVPSPVPTKPSAATTASGGNNDEVDGADATTSASAEVSTSHYVASASAASSAITLRRLMVWIQEPLQRLRIMGVLVQLCAGQKGGAVLSTIYTYMSHGDPSVLTFVNHLLHEVCKPFYVMLKRWMYEGELEDPFNEFFVATDPNVIPSAGGTGGSTVGVVDGDMWRSKYFLRHEMIPTFMVRSLAKKITSIGKSLNFIRYSCNEEDYIRVRNLYAASMKGLDEDTNADHRYGGGSNLKTLVSTVNAAYRLTSSRLLDILFNKFKLMDHLLAIKRYMLLGQGDFVQYLMDALSPSLDKAANSIYRHNLTSTLEAAIRASNAQYDDPEILKRLDVRLLEAQQGDSGWDIFNLDYHVDSPLDTILHADAMRRYRSLFVFLWRLKRTEHVLSRTWRQFKTRAESFRAAAGIGADLHRCWLVWSEMIHFAYQLQYYMLFEVLECSWQELADSIKKGIGDLDLLITAHNRYLNNVCNKGLMAREGKLVPQVWKILSTILKFKNGLDLLYAYACNELAKKDINKKANYTNVLEARLGLLEMDPTNNPLLSLLGPDGLPLSGDQNPMPIIREKLDESAEEFHTELNAFLTTLNNHPDSNLRQLSTRLNFNQYYFK